MLTSASLVAENTFTTAVQVKGEFAISISGTWAGTITLQRSHDNGTTYHDVNSWATNFEGVDFEPGRDEWHTSVYYKLGFKTSAYTSGTAVCAIW